jgi:hypothetical protein
MESDDEYATSKDRRLAALVVAICAFQGDDRCDQAAYLDMDAELAVITGLPRSDVRLLLIRGEVPASAIELACRWGCR